MIIVYTDEYSAAQHQREHSILKLCEHYMQLNSVVLTVAFSRFETSLTKLYCLLDDHVHALKQARETADVKRINKEQIAASKTFK